MAALALSAIWEYTLHYRAWVTIKHTRVLWDMVEGPMPRGILGLGSGDIHLVNDAWVLFLGGYSTSFRNRLYCATAPASADPATADWEITVDRRGRASPLLADPPRHHWDGGGVHTPSYLPGTEDRHPRIYYAGRSGRRHVGASSRYAIGVLEHHDGRWNRRDEPLVQGDGTRPSALEPLVVHDGDRYVMWYVATPHEVGRGEQPDYELRTTTSDDGLTGWTPPRVWASAEEGFFDNAIVRTTRGWTMVLARGTNLHATNPFPPQGLWVSTANTPDPDRSAWSPPTKVLDTDAADTPSWMGRGVCDPAIAESPDGSLSIFVTGTRRYRSRVGLVAARLRHRKRPPVPAPFYLSTAVLKLDQ